MGELTNLAGKLNNLAASLPKKASALASFIAKEIVEELTQVTPVDTSQALSNWQATLDEPALAFIPPFVPGLRGSTKEQSAGIAIELADAVIATKTPSQPIFITNNAPYIVDLNTGASGQNPGGFVEIAILNARLDITFANLMLQGGIDG